MKPLPCPFCGSAAVPRLDGAEPRPFFIRCSRPTCPGHNTEVRHADPEMAMTAWNQRAQMPPPQPQRVADVTGFTTKNLIRGEMVEFYLDRTGVFQSDKMQFSPWSTPLAPRPPDA